MLSPSKGADNSAAPTEQLHEPGAPVQPGVAWMREGIASWIMESLVFMAPASRPTRRYGAEVECRPK